MASNVHSFAMAHNAPRIAEATTLWWLSDEHAGRSFVIVEADSYPEATAKARSLEIIRPGAAVIGIPLDGALGIYLLDDEINVLLTAAQGDALGERVLDRMKKHNTQEN